MSYLRKSLWCLGLILLISLLRIIIEFGLSEESVFINNFLSVVQVAVLLWTIILLSAELTGYLRSTGKKLIIFTLVIALPEIVFTYWLNHPSQIPKALIPLFRHHYNETERNIIQFNSAYSAYNKTLFYTLKPSTHFTFNNYEFSDSFQTNSLGLRDHEISLQKPEIVCLGDSYTMGWGVKQNETFPKILEELTHKKVLNAAISSYGTARELINLSRIDTSNLYYIVIQYCRNDLSENEEFIKANHSLKISSEDEYKSVANEHYWNKLWYPCKHVVSITKTYLNWKLTNFYTSKKAGKPDSSAIKLQQSARYFADILLHAAIDFRKTKVIVLDLNYKDVMNNDFLNELKVLTDAEQYKTHFNNNLILLPVTDIIKSNDYYILDQHLRASGHQKIAAYLNTNFFEK